MSTFTLAIFCLTTSNLPRFMDLTFQVPMQYALYSIGPCFYHQSHPQLGIVFALAPSLHSFWSYFSTDFTTAVSNSMKPSHACGATQDGWVMVERSDRMWSTGEGNGKPLQYSCLENPMNSMKRKNNGILKEVLPRSAGAQYATGDSGEITPERMKRWSQSKNNTQLWM